MKYSVMADDYSMCAGNLTREQAETYPTAGCPCRGHHMVVAVLTPAELDALVAAERERVDRVLQERQDEHDAQQGRCPTDHRRDMAGAAREAIRTARWALAHDLIRSGAKPAQK